MDFTSPKYKTIVGISVAVVISFLMLLIPRLLNSFLHLSSVNYFYLTRISIWIGFLTLLLYCYKIEKQKLLLWKEKKYSFGKYSLYVLLFFVITFFTLMIVGVIAILLGVKLRSESMETIIKLFRSNYFLIITTCITAGITEELIFRGYILTRLYSHFNHPVLPIIISSVIFGLFHFGYGTFINIFGPACLGLVFGFFYYKYRNIKLLIFCHFLWDFVVVLLKIKFTPH